MKNKDTIIAESMFLLAQLQLVIEKVEEFENLPFWSGGDLKKRTQFFKKEVDKRLNTFIGGDEETQKQTFDVIKALEDVNRGIYEEFYKELRDDTKEIK